MRRGAQNRHDVRCEAGTRSLGSDSKYKANSAILGAVEKQASARVRTPFRRLPILPARKDCSVMQGQSARWLPRAGCGTRNRVERFRRDRRVVGREWPKSATAGGARRLKGSRKRRQWVEGAGGWATAVDLPSRTRAERE